MLMEKRTREQYASPRCELLEMRLEGIMVVSPQTESTPAFPSDGFGEEQDWSGN